MNDDFYIGWEEKAPPTHFRTARSFVVVIVFLAVVAGLILALSQRSIDVARFEWGNVKELSGVLRATPYPHLVVPDEGTGQTAVAVPLVAPFKFGLKCEAICGFDGQRVMLRATRIHRSGQLMLEVEPESIRTTTAATGAVQPASGNNRGASSLGHHTFRGEIVDSKCWMGVMNPGVLTPHRACAVRCISGGIPPMLLVRRTNAPPLGFLLVSHDDRPVNDEVLDFVAEPVEISGELVRHGELLVFRIHPPSIRRLGLTIEKAANGSRP